MTMASSPTSYQHVNYTHMHIDRVALCRLAYLYHTVKVASSYRSQLNYLYSTLDLLPIIIMLPAQTATYPIHLTQPKSHTNDKKQSQEAICSISHMQIKNECRGVEEFCVKKNLQELWKKQIRCFLDRSVRIHGWKSREQLKNSIMLSIDLVKQLPCQLSIPYLQSLSHSKVYCAPLKNFFQSQKRSKKPAVLIVSPHHLKLDKKDLLLSFVVLSLEGCIFFQKILPSNWGSINSEKSCLHRNYKIKFSIVKNREQLMNSISTNQTEIRDFIDQMIDFEAALNDQGQTTYQQMANGAQEVSERSTSQSESIKNFREPLMRFNFIMQQLQQVQIGRQQYRALYSQIIPLTYNLNFPLVNSFASPLWEQCSPSLGDMRHYVMDVIKHHERLVKTSVRTKHLPMELENARRCRKCQSVRVYLACQSCSINDDQVVALCYECFGPYHTSITLPQTDPQDVPLYLKWEFFDSNINHMMNRIQTLPEHPLKCEVKTQQKS